MLLLYELAKALVRFNIDERQADAEAVLMELHRLFKSTPLSHQYEVTNKLTLVLARKTQR